MNKKIEISPRKWYFKFGYYWSLDTFLRSRRENSSKPGIQASSRKSKSEPIIYLSSTRNILRIRRGGSYRISDCIRTNSCDFDRLVRGYCLNNLWLETCALSGIRTGWINNLYILNLVCVDSCRHTASIDWIDEIGIPSQIGILCTYCEYLRVGQNSTGRFCDQIQWVIIDYDLFGGWRRRHEALWVGWLCLDGVWCV